MSDDGLDVVLTWLDANARDLIDQARDDVAQTRMISGDLDELEARIARMRAELGAEPDPAPLPLVGLSELQRPAPGVTATPEWEALRAQAEQSLRSRGVDPSTVDLDSLLDPEEVERIARRFLGSFTVRTHLDRYDLAIMLIAGLTGALVEYLVVNGAPRSVDDLRNFKPRNEGLTSFIQTHSLSSKNELSRLAKVPFDQQWAKDGTFLPGVNPNNHRGISLGHDAMSMLTFGVHDLLTGDMSVLAPGGLSTLPGSSPPVADLTTAVQRVVAHLLSDAYTTRGVQAPGWTLLNVLPYASDGKRVEAGSLVGFGADMYGKGYESRHFLTMATSVAAVEIVLRAYWALRCEYDEEYAHDVRREAELSCSKSVSDHPRYLVLAFGAHALVCAANAGKVVLSGNNFLLVNALEWTRFVQVALRLAESRSASPTDVLIRTGLSNVEALANGWPDIDVGDPRLPPITA